MKSKYIPVIIFVLSAIITFHLGNKYILADTSKNYIYINDGSRIYFDTKEDLYNTDLVKKYTNKSDFTRLDLFKWGESSFDTSYILFSYHGNESVIIGFVIIKKKDKIDKNTDKEELEIKRGKN